MLVLILNKTPSNASHCFGRLRAQYVCT